MRDRSRMWRTPSSSIYIMRNVSGTLSSLDSGAHRAATGQCRRRTAVASTARVAPLAGQKRGRLDPGERKALLVDHLRTRGRCVWAGALLLCARSARRCRARTLVRRGRATSHRLVRALVVAGGAGARFRGRRRPAPRSGPAAVWRSALAAPRLPSAARTGGAGDPRCANRDHDDLRGHAVDPLRAQHRAAAYRRRVWARRSRHRRRVFLHHRRADPGRGAAHDRAGFQRACVRAPSNRLRSR